MVNVIKEELTQKVYHPRRVMHHIYAHDYDVYNDDTYDAFDE